MGNKYVLGDKEKTFLLEWSAIRKKGKASYILTRGSLFGLIIFNFWVVVTIVEINMSDFKLALYTWESFLKSCTIWFTLEFLLGFVIAIWCWKGREEMYHHYVFGHLSLLEILELRSAKVKR
jgi:hypothetical protein